MYMTYLLAVTNKGLLVYTMFIINNNEVLLEANKETKIPTNPYKIKFLSQARASLRAKADAKEFLTRTLTLHIQTLSNC